MRDAEPLRVMIAEDEVLLRHGLSLMLRGAGMEILATVADFDALMSAVDRTPPDIVITDIRMPPTFSDEGLVAATSIRSAYPQTAVMVLSQHVQRRYALELLGIDPSETPPSSARAPGRVGYLLKQRIADVDAFISDLRAVASGGTAIDPEVIAIMVTRAARADTAVAQLTPRQLEVLALLAQGRSNAAIAAAIFITEKAVVQHVSRIYTTLGLPPAADAHRRVQAVLRYLSLGTGSVSPNE